MTTVPTEYIGIYRSVEQALMLKDRASTNGLPQYVACSWAQVERLVRSLLDPAQTVYATCQVSNRYHLTECIAVPFEALKPEWQCALDGIYLYPPSNAPADVWRLYLRCIVTDFQPSAPTEGSYLMLPVKNTPSWEALVPAYLSCLEHAVSIARLLSVCAPGTKLTSVVLELEQAVQKQAYRAVPWQVLRDDARAQLTQPGAGLFFCLYPAHLADHPLLKPFWRLFKGCKIEG